MDSSSLGTLFAHRKGKGASPTNFPEHVAIIMDGNGRWATQRGLSRTIGHKQGIKTVKSIIEFALETDIKSVTLFTFGQENWRRPSKEVRNLHRLFFLMLKKESSELVKNGVQLSIIGERENYPLLLQEAMQEAESLFVNNKKLHLTLAINYSGRWDLTRALKRISNQILSQKLSPSEVNESLISSQLSLANLTEPDLLIRTGGVQRLSNFCLWEMAYTELYFSNLLWPDFTVQDFKQALTNFANRERRYGLTSDQVETIC